MHAVGYRAEPCPQLPQRADPLTGMYDVADAVIPLIGRAEVRVAAEHRIMKKTGAPVCTDAPVCDQTLYELPVNAAFWVVYDLLEFELVFSHGVHPFLSWRFPQQRESVYSYSVRMGWNGAADSC